MPLLSGMTGFARVEGRSELAGWIWEARSVNGRSLDIRVTLPAGFEGVEREVRAVAGQHFQRGSLQVGLRIDASATAAQLEVNEPLLTRLVEALARVGKAPPSDMAIANLMGIKGVVETASISARELAENDAFVTAIGAGLRECLEALKASRLREGEALLALLQGQLDEMRSLLAAARSAAARQPELVRERLVRQLDELDVETRIDADRLAAEVALTAARADVREELDRLAAHIVSAAGLVGAGSPAGRKLDFLAQEMNREANTLCSKSASLELTNVGLGLKGVIDQFKEQAANVE